MRFYFWEFLAVVLSLSYTFLIGTGWVYAFPFAIIASVIYVVLCLQKKIYAESLLHLFYFFMGIYGWLTWQNNTADGFQSTLSITTHLIAIPSLFLLTYVSGRLLQKYTDARAKYIDSFTTIFSIWATYLMVNVYLENWWYFIFINGVAVYLYAYRKMYLTSALMVVYVFLSIKGYWEWTTM